MPTVLILANETIAGGALLDRIKERARGGRRASSSSSRRPSRGTATSSMTTSCATPRRSASIWRWSSSATSARSAHGEVGDADPFNAAMDAIRAQPIDEIIVSTLPETASGWLRRDLIERLEEEAGLPVEHVVVDLAA